ncbi:hypothetical protein [Marinicella sp. W31]|uniref:hypothetical protein n=1 Tax=Marinicella sp. W31 TaxID=3023713 RepID=UPI0037584952
MDAGKVEIKMITFFGNQTGEFGLPIPYHNYAIVVGLGLRGRNLQATVMSVSTDTPEPQDRFHNSTHNNVSNFFEEIIAIISNYAENKGLNKSLIYYIPEET